MTANAMRNLFKELYDGASAQEMGFDDVEVSRFFNLAQTLEFNELYFTNRNQVHEGFELSSKRDVQLNNLKRSATLWYNTNTSHWVLKDYIGIINPIVELFEDDDKIQPFNSVLFEIPSNFLYIVNDTVDLKSNTNKLYRTIKVKNLNEDNKNDILQSPFNKPSIKVCYRSLEVKDLLDDYKIVRLYLPTNYKFNRWNVTYIKRPIEIVVDILNPLNQVNCELDEMFHNDIVFKAVELAMGSIGSQKIQIANYNTSKNVN